MTLKVTLIASVASIAVGFYLGYKVADANLQEYINASNQAYIEAEATNKQDMIELEASKDETISHLMGQLKDANNSFVSLNDAHNRLLDSLRKQDAESSPTTDSCESLRETLRERSSIIQRCTDLLGRCSKDYLEDSLKHDALVDIINSYQHKVNTK